MLVLLVNLSLVGYDNFSSCWTMHPQFGKDVFISLDSKMVYSIKKLISSFPALMSLVFPIVKEEKLST